MSFNSLEEIIRVHVAVGRKNTNDWEECLHTGCDHGKKGNRAGFRFGTNGLVAFHCFNCGTKTVYDPSTHKTIPKTMAGILRDFGIDDSLWNSVILNNLGKQGGSQEQIQADLKIEPKELNLPECFYKLSDADEDDKWAMIATDYIEYDRQLTPDMHNFMLSKQTDDLRFKKWFGRLIIPVYKGEKLVYYQGRDLTQTAMKKYESPPDSKERVLYGFDKLFTDRDKPLYITEGVFDAMLVNGAAIMGNKLSEAHIAWLNKSPRQKVFIPDRFGDGADVALKCLELGWSVSVPYEKHSWDSSIKDITDAVHKYGKLYVMTRIVETTATGFAGKAIVTMNCS